ncbi:YheC/YheD family protein [Lysinibacillus sp. NPDC097287]|uniref:YheC/YheD family protein n=1 Tax=Lysinibacillus sp. NPDC097287 TaxID=3364144 RepID=UPI00381018ED
MKASRGRFTQFKILSTDESLRKHIVKTELLTKQSLFNMLDLNEPLVIKAVYNTDEICILHKNNLYHIQTTDKVITVHDKEALYPALKNEMKQKFYIIQKSPTSNDIFRHFVTMHRNTALSEWYVASKTKKIRTTFNPLMSEIYFKKMEQVVIRAATKLGESYPDCHLIVLDIACDWRRNIWIYDSVLHFPNSKWSQYHILSKKLELRKYLPNTDLLTRETFSYYLHRYQSIILKPCIGQNGIGVIQISRKCDSTYEIHAGIKKLTKLSLDEAYYFIKRCYLSKREYIVQQRIALATINKCPIDIRVVTQKMSAMWSVTGKIVKVAGEQFFITNAAQKLLTLEQAIYDAEIPQTYIENLVPQLNKICLLASDLLEENIQGLSIIGFDIGITKNGSLWIIECNKVPDINMFNELEDKTMYHTILDVRNSKKQ